MRIISIFWLISCVTPEQIRVFRKSKGLTQTALGALCGVGKASVSDWESGKSRPSGAARLLLAEYMSGHRCILPLTEQEERLLDENVRKGNFASREDFLAACLIHLIKHGGFDRPPRSGR